MKLHLVDLQHANIEFEKLWNDYYSHLDKYTKDGFNQHKSLMSQAYWHGYQKCFKEVSEILESMSEVKKAQQHFSDVKRNES